MDYKMQISYHKKHPVKGWHHVITADAKDPHAWRTDQDQFVIQFINKTGAGVVTMGASMWEVVK
jgi:hypothetical protein